MHRLRRRRSWARCRTTRAGSKDSGAMSLELAVVFPVVMTLIFTIITVSFWYHARNVALSAAQRGVDSARVQGATIDQGLAVANSFLDRAGGSISHRSVTGSDGNTVTIDVSGTVTTWIPGLRLPVHQHASGARERVAGLP